MESGREVPLLCFKDTVLCGKDHLETYQIDVMRIIRAHAVVANAREGLTPRLPTDERSETSHGGGVLSPRNRQRRPLLRHRKGLKTRALVL